MKSWNLFGAFIAAALGFALVLACEATVKVRGSENTPVIGETEVELSLKGGHPPTIEAEPTDTTPKGTCVRYTFTDGSGNVTGTAEAEVGGDPVPVPPGTEEVTVSPCDPKPPEKGKKPKSSSSLAGEREGLFVSEEEGLVFFYRTVPISMLDGRGRFVDFTVKAAARDDADVIARNFLAGGIIARKNPAVETYGFAFLNALDDGRIQVAMISDDAPKALEFRWNGRRLFDLRRSKVFNVNGWYATSVVVPSSLVDFSLGGSSNDMEFELEAGERKLGLSSAVKVTL